MYSASRVDTESHYDIKLIHNVSILDDTESLLSTTKKRKQLIVHLGLDGPKDDIEHGIKPLPVMRKPSGILTKLLVFIAPCAEVGGPKC